MAHPYAQALELTRALLERLRIPVTPMQTDTPLSACDGGLRRLLGLEEHAESAAGTAAHQSRERTVYRLTDPFGCRYVYFRLPMTDPPALWMLGPYLTADCSREDLLELAEKLRIPLSYVPQLAHYFASLPVCHDPATIFAVVYALGDVLWGSSGFDTVDTDAWHHSLPAAALARTPIEQTQILRQMQQVEDRYADETRLMDIVSKGLTHQAEMLTSSISQLNFPSRTDDPLRNRKNYCIVFNTLLRKAAQQGGVHPFYIDRMSSRFARAIEHTSSLEDCSALLRDMTCAYCRLVHEHALGKYSPAIQKVISYIDANLSGDLSLTTLARLIQVTPSYLSTLFHRETGHTLADHITSSRMKAALQLLKTTHLQVQTVAQLCGFSDPNYFGRQFKRFFHLAPLQYRRTQAGHQASKPWK